MVVHITHKGAYSTYGGDILLTERGLFPAVCRSTTAETI